MILRIPESLAAAIRNVQAIQRRILEPFAEIRAFLRIQIDAEGRPLVTQTESETGFEMEISTELAPNMARV